MMNMQQMMKQAQKMQKQLEKKQAELAETNFTGKSAQELVTVTFTGDKKLVSIDYKEAVVDPEDVETLQAVSYTHLRAHETRHDLVCRLLLEKKKKKITNTIKQTIIQTITHKPTRLA